MDSYRPWMLIGGYQMHQEKILILAKTYPAPSGRYDEIACVAGINENGEMRRLYPIKFRFLDDEQQFKKWQWITARVNKAPKDHRPESHNIDADSLECGRQVETGGNWESRRSWLDRIPTFENEDQLEEARKTSQTTLALLYPLADVRLEITPTKNQDWTPEERERLSRHEHGDLFRPEMVNVPILRKVPFDFHYKYIVKGLGGIEKEQKHKIVDWEACRLYWRCRNDYGQRWEEYFRKKLELDLGGRDLMFLMGTMHRFPDQWLIVSLIYPPKREPGFEAQGRLFD